MVNSKIEHGGLYRDLHDVSKRIKEAGYEIFILSIAGTDSTKALFKSSMTSKDMSEDDKISQMMSDSGDFYNQKNWLQLRGRNAYAGQKVPQNYKCNRCNQSGHFIYDCPQGKIILLIIHLLL